MPTALYQIEVDGTDVSSTFDPLLITLSVKLDDKGACDELTIELDDSYGQIALPRTGAQITAQLGWTNGGVAPVFVGTVDAPKSSSDNKGKSKHGHHHGGHDHGGSGPVHLAGSRSKGRTLTLTAKSADMTSNVKKRTSAHLDNASFQVAATQFGQKAGLTVKVGSDLASVQRPYWSMHNESFMAWGERHARQLDATFKIFGTQAVFVSRSGGQSVSGQDLEDIDVAWGLNLIDWSITPILSRNDYGSFCTRWYDPVAATWNREQPDGDGSSGGTSSSSVQHTHEFKAPAQDHAKRQSGSNQTESGREKGCGDSVVIDGEPAAMPGANANVIGIRDGVDGTYLISEVTHSLSRHAGFTTHLTLKQPAGSAGTDSRATSGSSSSSSGSSGSSGSTDSETE